MAKAKAKGKIKKTRVNSVPEPVYDDEKWRARDDARTLASAAAIKRDKDRMKKASVAAKELQVEESKRATEAKLTANAMNRLANKKL